MSTPVELSVGDRLAPRTIGPISQTDIVRFAGAGGDFNPLHHDHGFAAAAGFAQPIAMGQMTAGLLAAWVTDWCGVENLLEYEVRFSAPVSIGDVVELSGEVTALTPQDNGSSRMTVRLAATREGSPVLTGQTVLTVTTD
ncbi:MaoC family dehydratase [Streptomyces sp. NPDC055092]